MERWCGRIAVVTGASAGLGWAVAKRLLNAGMVVVGMANEYKDPDKLCAELKNDEQRKAFHMRICDLTKLNELKAEFKWTETEFGRINVLINNAGGCYYTRLLDENNEKALRGNIELNLMTAIFCMKSAYPLMRIAMKKGEDCHIVTVNSLLGQYCGPLTPLRGWNVYPVAKHALRVVHEVVRREIKDDKLLRLSEISPGLIQTAFGTVDASATNLVERENPKRWLQAEDLADGVEFILSTPQHVVVAQMLMVPTDEIY